MSCILLKIWKILFSVIFITSISITFNIGAVIKRITYKHTHTNIWCVDASGHSILHPTSYMGVRKILHQQHFNSCSWKEFRMNWEGQRVREECLSMETYVSIIITSSMRGPSWMRCCPVKWSHHHRGEPLGSGGGGGVVVCSDAGH